jgi:hypothetical protein
MFLTPLINISDVRKVWSSQRPQKKDKQTNEVIIFVAIFP